MTTAQWCARMSVSLAPHSYLFAMFAMADRLELYILLRATLMNALMLLGLLLQRSASSRVVAEYRSQGALA